MRIDIMGCGEGLAMKINTERRGRNLRIKGEISTGESRVFYMLKKQAQPGAKGNGKEGSGPAQHPGVNLK